ncbi:thiamine pyrophosphate-dependent enzyme [Pseudofrankia sp. BMG5.37]|uniref:thiamine pyrophosphate-dependent enzyme n=1 Tax=Pseudofrankia sp. BMG5.37 TaxID=3050035 RepID=UPI0037CC83AE
MYTDMVIIRRLDEEATALQRQGELGLWAPLRGQEAAQVGSARALAPDDMAFPSYREHGVAYCRGVDPVAILGLFRGSAHGGWDPNEHGFALYAIVVGSQTLHATGYAMGVSRETSQSGWQAGQKPAAEATKGNTAQSGWQAGQKPAAEATKGNAVDCATIAYFGDGASSQGDVGEAFGWAAVFGAPVVFFCQNNQYAISEPTTRQSRVPISHRAAGHGFPGVRVDGNDVLATLAVTRWALARARAGEGPTLIEAVTYRMGAHTTADDPTRYRDADEVARWAKRDPLARVRAHLTAQNALDDTTAAAVAARADEAAADLRRRCLALPDPEPLSMFDHVTVVESGHVAAERADLADFLGTDDRPPAPSSTSPRAASADAAHPSPAHPTPAPADSAPADSAPVSSAPVSSAPRAPSPPGSSPPEASLAAARPVAPPPQTPGPEASCPR